MLRFFWRGLHFYLAVCSSVFLLLLAISGFLLALMPVFEKQQVEEVANTNSLSVARVLWNVQEKYPEIVSLEQDRLGQFILEIVPNKNQEKVFCIDPHTGGNLGDPVKTSSFFTSLTTFHRSLFLKSTGRFLVGISALFLFLISIAGVFLLWKREGSLRNLLRFSTKDTSGLFWHSQLGKWTFVPIVIVAITGVYLSMERFRLLPEKTTFTIPQAKEMEVQKPQEFSSLEGISIGSLESLVFPFFIDPEEYYTLRLQDREMYLSPYDGSVLVEIKKPVSKLLLQWSVTWHTGYNSIVWAILLALSSLAIVYFMYSGFRYSWRSRKKLFHNSTDRDASTFVILVGSEGGSTYAFASALQKALLAKGESCYIAPMNQVLNYRAMQHLILMVATYGQGEAPSNAGFFIDKIAKKPFAKGTFTYSVIGFGAIAYPHFCAFAIQTQKGMEAFYGASLLPIHTVNNQSQESFLNWVASYQKKINISLEAVKVNGVKVKTLSFEVLERSDLVSSQFFLRLKIQNKVKVQSGDLLSVLTPGEEEPRLYSIAVLNGEIWLSIKKHSKGVCSTFLFTLERKAILQASILSNTSFHFPKHRKELFFIANGTGIAPFLGMIHAKESQAISKTLLWGTTSKAQESLYRSLLEENTHFQYAVAYSREERKEYVQVLVKTRLAAILSGLERGACVMICGSLTMQEEVLEILEIGLEERKGKHLSFYKQQGQLLMDCY